MTDLNATLCKEILEHAPIGILIQDWDGRIEQCNSAYCRLLAYEHEALQGMPFLDLLRPQDAKEWTDQIARLKNGELPEFDLELHHLHRLGSEVPLRAHVFALPGNADRAPMIAAMFADMTDQIASAEELARMRRMESIGRLASGVAHDSNNVLALVTANLQLALDMVDDPSTSEKISNAIAAAEMGMAFNKRLLSMAGRRKYAPERCNLNARIRTASALLDRVMGEDVELVLDLDEELNLCRVDTGEVDSALLNLVTNARDAMTDGGKIVIRTRNVRRSDGSANPDNMAKFVELIVGDDGDGMPPEVLRKATEPFFTTKPPGKGTGLGLPSVVAFAKLAGGIVEIESIPGDGTTVRLQLPALS